MKITIEQICDACEKGPCEQPCELWYRCLNGVEVREDELLKFKGAPEEDELYGR